jgi:Uncharacterized protein conserved in bacteria (DUF2188)
MPKQGDVHVIRGNNGGWQVRVEGKTRAQSIHNTQAEAAAVGKEIARRNKSELLNPRTGPKDSRPQHVRARPASHQGLEVADRGAGKAGVTAVVVVGRRLSRLDDWL